MSITIYTTPTCPWCNKVKEYLKDQNQEFNEVDVSTDEKAREEMIQKSGQIGVPVIDISETIIVGFDSEQLDRALKVLANK